MSLLLIEGILQRSKKIKKLLKNNFAEYENIYWFDYTNEEYENYYNKNSLGLMSPKEMY